MQDWRLAHVFKGRESPSNGNGGEGGAAIEGTKVGGKGGKVRCVSPMGEVMPLSYECGVVCLSPGNWLSKDRLSYSGRWCCLSPRSSSLRVFCLSSGRSSLREFCLFSGAALSTRGAILPSFRLLSLCGSVGLARPCADGDSRALARFSLLGALFAGLTGKNRAGGVLRALAGLCNSYRNAGGF